MVPTLLLASSALILACWLFWRFQHRKLLALSAQLPGPPTLPVLGNALMFMMRPEALIELMQDIRKQYGDLVRFWLGPDLNVVVSDPQDVRILLTSTKTTQKGVQYKFMADVLGGGILSGSGPVWRRHRKIVNPNYGKRATESYGDIFNHEVRLLVDRLDSSTGRQISIYREVVRATSYAVCQALMGLTKEETMNLPYFQQVIDISPRLYFVVFNRMTIWWKQIDPAFRLTEDYRQQKKFLSLMYPFCEAIIGFREKALRSMTSKQTEQIILDTVEDSMENTKLSVIDRLILSKELSANEMVEETFTIFTSSQEASAKIASFLLIMMAYHPHSQEKLYQEIMTVVGWSDTVSEENIKQMPYLDMVFREVVRLFPIGCMIQRTVVEDITISNATIPAGCSLVIPIYHIHRDPRFWENPDSFDPERFTAEASRNRPAASYIPFSLGPMDCLGRHVGTKLVKTVAVHVLRRFILSSEETYKDLKLAFAISVTSKSGFNLTLTPRK